MARGMFCHFNALVCPILGLLFKSHLEKQHTIRNQQLFPSPSSQLESTPSGSANTFTDAFIAGALSGCVAAFLTTPFDVGKTRIQVLQHAAPLSAKETRPHSVRSIHSGRIHVVYKSMPSLLHGIWKDEGVRGLWRGCVPRMLKVAPACAIMISSYEVGKQWAERINERRRLQKAAAPSSISNSLWKGSSFFPAGLGTKCFIQSAIISSGKFIWNSETSRLRLPYFSRVN